MSTVKDLYEEQVALDTNEIRILEQMLLGIQKSHNPTLDIANELNLTSDEALTLQKNTSREARRHK